MRALYRLRRVAAIARSLSGARAGASTFASITHESTATYAEHWEDAAELNVAHSPLTAVNDTHDMQQLLVPSR